MINLDTLRALVDKVEVLKHEHGRFTSKWPPGTPFDGGVTDAQSEVIYAAGKAAPALAALIAEFEKAVGLLAEATPMLASEWVTVEECKAVAARISAFLAACADDSETGRLNKEQP